MANNKLLKKIVDNVSVEGAFIDNKRDTYIDIINQYKEYFTIINKYTEIGLKMCNVQFENRMLQLSSTNVIINILQDKFSHLLDLHHRISNMPEIQKIIKPQKH